MAINDKLNDKKCNMTKFKFFLIATTLFCLITNYSYGQGCSDAGFCTLNSFKPNNIDSTQVLNNQFKIGAFFGNADNSISVYGNYLEYNRQLTNKFGLDLKLNTLSQNGNGISTFGLSDIFLNTIYKVSEKVKLTLGAKIPLSKADKTNDLRKFQSTNKFERSGDVLLRVSYPINITSKLKLTPSILPIYHLTNDKYTDEFNVKKEIIGSQGLTLNGNAYLDYEINSKNIIQLNLGIPFIVRDIRPDGLTRSFIANIEYRIKF